MHHAASGMNGGVASAPDPLTRAFNEAIKPYVEEIEVLRAEVDAAQARIRELEVERGEWHAWVDKRGLRPGECLVSSLRAQLHVSVLFAAISRVPRCAFFPN